MSPEPQVFEQRVRLYNESSRDLDLVIEPWGEDYPFPPGAKYDVIGRSLEPDSLEIVARDTTIEVWPMFRAQLFIVHDGVDVTPRTRGLSPPELPPGKQPEPT